MWEVHLRTPSENERPSLKLVSTASSCAQRGKDGSENLGSVTQVVSSSSPRKRGGGGKGGKNSLFYSKLQWGIPNTRKNIRKHSPRNERRWFSLLEQSNSGTTVSQHWGPPRVVEVNSNTWESPEWQLWRFWCFSQLAHHQGSKSSEIGSKIALDGGHNVIKMASEALMGAKGFSCQGSHSVSSYRWCWRHWEWQERESLAMGTSHSG